MSKLWETGNESQQNREIATRVEAFTVGNDYLLDQQLLPYDLTASRIHVRALEKGGLLSADEADRLVEELEAIRVIWSRGEFEIRRDQEDGHTAIEAWLTRELGELGKKIHTGRSRNDQVLTAMRLLEMDHLKQTQAELVALVKTMLHLAGEHAKVPMPGYTHTRKAMLSSVGQWLGGYIELLIIQLEATDGVRKWISRSPLGTAAGFGTSISLDRDAEASELGFDGPLVCATSAQLSRGWAEQQLVNWLAGTTALLARFSSDIIQFSSEAYRFVDIDRVLTTGSSIMPQKKNPDVAELIRGSHSTLTGCVVSLQTLTTHLGSGYHRDLQLSKQPVLVALETTHQVLEAAALLVKGLSFDEKTLREACSNELMAAEEAYKLVREEGISFREAYVSVKKNAGAGSAISIEEILENDQQLGSPGNPGLDRLEEQLEAWIETHTRD
ncbi:MAG: argininosuccinate lyase [Balneolaceae bacterium]